MHLHNHRIVEQSHAVLDGLGHEVVGLQLAMERKLTAIGDPDISWCSETAETGFFRAIFGKRRDVLVVSHRRFREYHFVVLCQAHGTVLHVASMVLVSPMMRNDLRRAVRLDAEPGARFEVGGDLDAFDALECSGFLAIARLALRHAIQELTNDESKEDGEFRLGSGDTE